MTTLYDAERVTTAAARRLKASPHAAIRRVACFYNDGVLILSGDVPNYYQKQLAQAALAGLATVEKIANRIEVRDVRKEQHG
jgi:hypothetical protein